MDINDRAGDTYSLNEFIQDSWLDVTTYARRVVSVSKDGYQVIPIFSTSNGEFTALVSLMFFLQHTWDLPLIFHNWLEIQSGN